MSSINNPLFSFLTNSTANKIGDSGATSLSDALKSNTTLMKLNLWGNYKRNNTQMASINNPLFSILIKSTANNIGYIGATSLSDALKSNTTLTQLNLWCKHKKRNSTQIASIDKSLFSIIIKSTGNKIGERGAKTMSDALKSNTTLTKLNLCREDERNNTNGIHSFHYHQINRKQDWRIRSNIIE